MNAESARRLSQQKAKSLSTIELLNTIKSAILYHDHGASLAVLVIVLFSLSFFGAVSKENATGIYLEGEVAQHEIVADRDLLVEDINATEARRNQAIQSQPPIFDLDKESLARFRQDTLDFFVKINSQGEEGVDTIRAYIERTYGVNPTPASVRALKDPALQAFALNTALPWLEKAFAEGVLADMRQISPSQSALIKRDVDTGVETIRMGSQNLYDIRSLSAIFGQFLQSEQSLKVQERVALLEILPLFFLPTLLHNQEATLKRNENILRAIEPVFYRVKKGEVLVRTGDTVTYEQQLKSQSLLANSPGLIDLPRWIGTFCLAIFIALGLFMTPSTNRGRVLAAKDQYFIALLIFVFGVGALVFNRLLYSVDSVTAITALPFAFPVAGAAGLAALIFSARRYCVLGLLLSFFATYFLEGGLAMFAFFFLSAMANTWLVIRAHSRQDVVWSALPLFLWMLVTGLGVAAFDGMPMKFLPAFILSLAINTTFSILLLFALSPILELALGYTTRFRLMELMNLEQPLLQEMMMSIPGTYHHSLIVSNLVEAGAKAVGANSLLCKVGALYHDIGKLSYPDYFIENQFGGPNKHDKLSPAMSALILQSHVKKGIEFAQEYELGTEIQNIIGEHHGTRLIAFFYQKAVNLGENPQVQDYSYPGPRPQSKESAIVMVADSVEASCRTLSDPTPARIRTHVDTIIKDIFAEGQLDESDLTFKDLHKLSDSFARILTGLFHQRIVYPERTRDQKDHKTQVFPPPLSTEHHTA